MQRIVLVAALAAGILLVLATPPAFAKYAGYSAVKQYVPWATELALVTPGADGAALHNLGPHAGYATTTTKCVVCHSVHRGGSRLLNEGSSCAHCHTSTANGGGAYAPNLISWNATTNSGPHSNRCANTDCHGGPHGVGASAYAGPASHLISSAADTKIAADLVANGLPVSTLDSWNPRSRVLATGGLCSRSGCHDNSAFGVIEAGSNLAVSGVSGLSANDNLVTGHRVIAPATDMWSLYPEYGAGASRDAQVGFAPVTYCNSCHDLLDDNNGGKAAFPHGIDDIVCVAQGKMAGERSAVWLTAAASVNATKTAVGSYNQYIGDGSTVGGASGATILDGVCLKCHRSATAGVGILY